MKTPYLVQRLNKPYPSRQANPFSFGGGLIAGGINKEAFAILRNLWEYDYMGSAEFEWGAIPKSLDHINSNASKYITGQITVIGKCMDWHKDKDIERSEIVYYACTPENEVDVRNWIGIFANDKKRNYNTKEAVCLADAICKTKYKEDLCGWHDIDNHFVFFTDQVMFRNFCELFKINHNNTIKAGSAPVQLDADNKGA